MNVTLKTKVTSSVSAVLFFVAAWMMNTDDASANELGYSIIAHTTETKVAEVIAFDELEVVQLVVFPSDGGFRHLSSGFGYRAKACDLCSTYHQGADFTAGYGSRVRAATYGRVVDIGWMGGEGFSITIRHYAENGFPNTETVYAHLIQNSNQVRVGDMVEPNQVIAKIGQTGVATAPHLHFEVRVKGIALDPVVWLRQNHAK